MNFAWPKISTLALAAVAGLLAGFALWGRGKPPVVPAATQREIAALKAGRAHQDSVVGALQADTAAFWKAQRATAQSVQRLRDSTATATHRAEQLAGAAKLAGHLADSLAAVAALADTQNNAAAAYYRDAYQDRSREADSLRLSNNSLFWSVRQMQFAVDSLDDRAKRAEGRVSQIQPALDSLWAANDSLWDVNNKLQVVIDKSQAPSRWSLAATGGPSTLVTMQGKAYAGLGLTAGLSRSFRLPCFIGCGIKTPTK